MSYSTKGIGMNTTNLPHTDRLLHSRFDVSPCESEPQDDPTPVPLVKGSVAGAVIVCLCIFAGVAVAVIAWATN